MRKLYRQPLFTINALIFLFIVAVSAKSTEECSVMVPMMGTIWKTNEIVTVRWSGIKEGKIPSIILARKNEEGVLVDVTRIASDIPAGPGKYSLKLPANIPPADQYIVMLKNRENTECTSSSFFIEKGSSTGPADIQNPLPNVELPSPNAPTEGLSTGAPTNSPNSASPSSYTSTLTTSHSGQRSHTAHEAVRTGTAMQNPSSAAKTSGVVSHTLRLCLALIVLASMVAV